MGRPHALLRSGFPYYMTLGQRRVTSDPVDIGFGEENIYVLTRGNLGTEVRVINWEDENLGLRGVGNFTWPTSLLVDEDENLYVLDEAKSSVTIMDKDGETLNTWGETGSEQGQVNRPSFMDFDTDGNIVLSDTLNHRIQRFTRDGKHIQTIDNGNGSADGELNMPWGVAVDEIGDYLRRRLAQRQGPEVLRRWRVTAQHRLVRRPERPVQQARGGCGRSTWRHLRRRLAQQPRPDVHPGRTVRRAVHRRRQPVQIGQAVHTRQRHDPAPARDDRPGTHQTSALPLRRPRRF